MKVLYLTALVAFLAYLDSAAAAAAKPKVQIYSRNPGEYDKSNTLICHVSDFHPPDIKIELLKNNQQMEGVKQSDLAFEQGWHFHLTQTVPFTPKKGDTYSCRVSHSTLSDPKEFTWEPDM